MATLQDIKEAIDKLSPAERQSIAQWLHEITNTDWRVAEPASTYGALRESHQMSADEYLEFDATSAIKHEYVAGEVFAMSGASRRHNLVFGNLFRHAANAASVRRDCQVFGPDMKLHVVAHNCFYYPDLSVSCDSDDRDERFLTRPCCLIEVLSPTTASIDRREKRLSYESLPSLREYIVVEQDRVRADVYQREGGRWTVRVLSAPDDVVEISCLGLRLSLQQIYENIELPAQ